MKRTTYVIIGMLVAGLAVICGAIFYASCHMVGRESADAVEIGGERKTVELPECRVVKLLHSSIVREEHKRTVREPDKFLIHSVRFPCRYLRQIPGKVAFLMPVIWMNFSR